MKRLTVSMTRKLYPCVIVTVCGSCVMMLLLCLLAELLIDDLADGK